MRVAFICRNFVYPMGGFEEHIYQLAHRLIKSKIKVDIFTTTLFHKNRKRHDEDLEGINIHRFPISLSIGGYCYTKALKNVDLAKFDIVHVHGWGNHPVEVGILQSYKQRIPSVLTVHSFFHEERLLMIKILYNLLNKKRLISKTTASIALTKSQKKELERASAKQIAIIPNGIDSKRFQKITNVFPLKWGLEKYVLSVGRIEKYKGFQHIIRALRGIDIPLVIIGPDFSGYCAELVKLAKNNNVKLFLIGKVSTEELVSAYACARLFVLASHKEGFGIALIESLAAGTPVISTKTGIALDLPADICSLFDYANINQLKSLIIDKLEMKNYQISQKAKKFAFKNFSWEKIVKDHINFYEKIK